MNKREKAYVDHEVRVRLLEETYRKSDMRFASIDTKFAAIDARFITLDTKIDSHFRWTLGTMVAIAGITVSIMIYLNG